eukprot:jgi/Botrbrau1/15437/Bobra.43_2s0062.1
MEARDSRQQERGVRRSSKCRRIESDQSNCHGFGRAPENDAQRNSRYMLRKRKRVCERRDSGGEYQQSTFKGRAGIRNAQGDGQMSVERRTCWLQRGVIDAMKVIKEGPSQAALDAAQALASQVDEVSLMQHEYTMDGLGRGLLLLCQFHPEEGRPTAAFLALSRIVEVFPKIALQYVEALSDKDIKYTALAQLVSLTTTPHQEFCKCVITADGASALVCLLSDPCPYVQSVAAHLADKLITMWPDISAKFVEAGIVPVYMAVLEQRASREALELSQQKMKLFNSDLGGCDEWRDGRLSEGLLAEPRLHVCKALRSLVFSRSDVAEQVTAAALMRPLKEYSGETLIDPVVCLALVLEKHPDPKRLLEALLSDGLVDILPDFFEPEDRVLFASAVSVLTEISKFWVLNLLPLGHAQKIVGSLLTYIEVINDACVGEAILLIWRLEHDLRRDLLMGIKGKEALKLVLHLCPRMINGGEFEGVAAHCLVVELMRRAWNRDERVINAAMSNGFIAGTFRLLSAPAYFGDHVTQQNFRLQLLQGVQFMVAATDIRFANEAISRGLLGLVRDAVGSGARQLQLFGLKAIWGLALRGQTLAQLRKASVWPHLVLDLAGSCHLSVLQEMGCCLVMASRDHHSLLVEMIVMDALPQYKLSCRSTMADDMARSQLLETVRLLEEWCQAQREQIAELAVLVDLDL